MIDLQTTMEEQENLEKLCFSNRNFKNIEKYRSNAKYGHANIIKTYAGYPLDKPVNAVIPEGISFRSTVHSSELNAKVPAVFCFHDGVQAAWKKTSKVIIPQTMPFVYASALFDKHITNKPEPKGTLVSPIHSTQGCRIKFDWDKLAEKCLELPQPVRVMVHWFDIRHERHKAFENVGLSVVSCGYSTDENFLFRLLHFMSLHEYVAGNEIQTNSFYAGWLGKKPFIFGDGPILVIKPGSHSYTKKQKINRSSMRDLFLNGSYETIRNISAYQLGAHHFKTEEEVLADLNYVENLRLYRSRNGPLPKVSR